VVLNYGSCNGWPEALLDGQPYDRGDSDRLSGSINTDAPLKWATKR
jgi:hypothetical protein